MTKLKLSVLIFSALLVGTLVITYIVYASNRNSCVGRSRDEIISIAREGLLKKNPSMETAIANGAKVVQFIDWQDSRAGYTVYFQIPGERKFFGVTVSGACGMHFSYVKSLLPPI